jgi:uncharacterized ferredoxin-like protein
MRFRANSVPSSFVYRSINRKHKKERMVWLLSSKICVDVENTPASPVCYSPQARAVNLYVRNMVSDERRFWLLIKSEDLERDAALDVARLMLVAARTAPKAMGLDTIVTAIVGGEDQNKLADEMERIGKEKNLPRRIRDAGNVRNSQLVALIGVKYTGDPSNELKLVDLGIALGSASKIASDLNVDNRIMRSIGEAAENMKLLQADYVLGIPISIKGKSIFFDRPPIGTL